VGDKFQYAILALIGLSMAPMAIELIRHKIKKRKSAKPVKEGA
jgi:hypothetical protein